MPVVADRTPELAVAYRPNEVYERALLVADHHPEIRMHEKLSAIVPVYRARRGAAAAMIADDPRAKAITRDLNGNPGLRRIIPPPSEIEVAAMAAAINEAAKRWAALDERVVDEDAHRRAMREAAWSGDWRALVDSWASWMTDFIDVRNEQLERAQLGATLCLTPDGRQGSEARGHRWEPGDPLRGPSAMAMPWFGPEVDRAFRSVPLAPTGTAAKS